MNREPFVTGEFYHVYNHGVEDRNIVDDKDDSVRFLDSMQFFNTEASVGGLYAMFMPGMNKPGGKTNKKKLVNVVAFCLNPNHFHLLLEQVVDNGVSEFMKRLGGGYTLYFNNKHKRKGALFRGTFRSAHVASNEYLLYLSAYINLNYRVHKLDAKAMEVVRSSWGEYINHTRNLACKKDIVMEQFKNPEEYRGYAEDELIIMLENKEQDRELKYLGID